MSATLGGSRTEGSTVIDRVQASVVSIRDERRGAGAGVVWKADGLVVTNDHVARGRRVEVILRNGTAYPAEVVGRDETNDLTALRVPDTGLPAAEVGDSRALRAGEPVIAVGHPLGIENAVSIGVVYQTPQPSRQRELIAAHIRLNPGNSGGPLVNAAGQVVGVNAMVAPPGIGLAIPSHVVEAFLTQALGPRPYLGISAQPVALPESFQRRHQTPPIGLILTQVEPGGPAERAGLLVGDLVIAVDGVPVEEPGDLPKRVAAAGIDGRLGISIVRAETNLDLPITAGSYPG